MPSPRVVIVMYHYVRDVKNSAYPEIKGLEVALFREQLEYLARQHVFIRAEQLLDPASLPPRSALLTFDDGYIDHYENVFPVLLKRGICGVFAPVVAACAEGRVLDVNKIHFLLAVVPDKSFLVEAVDAFVLEHRAELGFTGPQYRRTMVKRRLDTPEVSYLKDMLQKVLPLKQRRSLLHELFARHVSADETDFAASLYMNPAQLQEMRDAGMALSIHGYSHRWLSTLRPEEQKEETDASINFLSSLGVAPGEMSVSYPYGDYNAETLVIMEQAGIRLGFGIVPAEASPAEQNLLTLPRFDTNDLPKNHAAVFKEPAP